jgi:hypothetical protein
MRLRPHTPLIPRTFRTWRGLGVVATIVALLAISFASASSALANLAGSTFEGGDGNLVVDTPGNTDWANVAGLAKGIEQFTGKQDNSFGQGTHEDDANVTVVTGSIPPNKSDLSRFYEASETIGGQTFLYLAWERTNVLGSANMDFEINQSVTPGLGEPGDHTINRAAGDLLVTFDFVNGGGTPVLGLNTWLTSGSQGSCFKANSAPCWGNHLDLNSTNSEGAVNAGNVTDPIAPGAPRTLAGGTFGEASINLTGAGVFPAGTCKAFGSTYLKSRSSASFTAEVKDFVAPVPVTIANCGQIIIHKVTVPSPDPTDTTFSYTTTGGLSPASFTLKNGGTRDYGTEVQAGSYSVTEADPGPNFALTGLDCSASDLSHGSTATTNTTTRTVSITLKAEDRVECTYTNTLHQGAIKIAKTSIKGPALAGAKFSIKDANGNPLSGSPFTTGSDGTVCVDHLVFGTYSVQETAAPPGYAIDDPTAHDVSVSQTSTCGDGNEATFSATDTPLTDLVITVTSEAAGGTSSTITCVNTSNDGIGNSPQTGESATVTATGLKPGTYTCTVVVDP